MILSLGNKKAKYILHFTYNRKAKGLTPVHSIVSSCKIKRLGDRKVIAVATSFLKGLQVNKVTRVQRRTRLFLEAMKDADFSRKERVKPWAEYARQCKTL